ncbi:hypothetical protein LTR95_007246 [Oleoguttula sp. CCFEE 5521]
MAHAPPSRVQRFVRANFTPAPLYPFKGIWYFTTHRYLHPLLRSRLIPLTVLSVGILALLFLAAYIPVVAFLALFHYRGSAWVNATFLVLEVGNLIIALIFEALFVDHTQVDIFDAVMVAEGYEHLVKNKRPVDENIDEADPIVEFVLCLPLNFIPFVGVPLFLVLTGYRAGPFVNWRYFALKGFTKQERNAFIKQKRRRFEYMWFGTVYMALQLVPVLSMLLLLTSAAGSALWSVHLEREAALVSERTDVDAEERPLVYRDEPV